MKDPTVYCVRCGQARTFADSFPPSRHQVVLGLGKYNGRCLCASGLPEAAMTAQTKTKAKAKTTSPTIDLITMADACVTLQYSRKTIYRMVAKGETAEADEVRKPSPVLLRPRGVREGVQGQSGLSVSPARLVHGSAVACDERASGGQAWAGDAAIARVQLVWAGDAQAVVRCSSPGCEPWRRAASRGRRYKSRRVNALG